MMTTVHGKRMAEDLTLGDSVGEYRIDDVLGAGGMGVVYLATQPLIGKRVAIKVVRRELCSHKNTCARFLDEARAVNRICHPNIVDIFSFGALADGRPFFVMELLDGESLRSRLERGRMPPLDVIDVLVPVCRALQAAHDKGVVHRDLKPDNIFLAARSDDTAQVKVLDFGIAKLEAGSGERAAQTLDGAVVGTPAYVAPEQVIGQHADWRSDVYSLGVVAFELFVGQAPFWAESGLELMMMHRNTPPPRPSALWAEIPRPLEQLLLRMLAKQPGERPSLDEVQATLSSARSALSPLRAAALRDGKSGRWWPRALLLLAVVALAAAVALVATRAWTQTPPAKEKAAPAATPLQTTTKPPAATELPAVPVIEVPVAASPAPRTHSHKSRSHDSPPPSSASPPASSGGDDKAFIDPFDR